MAPQGTSRSLLIFLLGVGVWVQVVQATKSGLLNKQKQLEQFIVDDGRIVGGVQTTAENFPWQLFVKTEKNGGTYVCGGSIISEAWSMSAAHCFASEDPDADEGHIITAEKIYLYAGVTDKYDLSDSAVQSNIFDEDDFEEHLFVHPEYKIGARFNNDIAIFKNKEPWTLNEYVSPIALATDDDFIVGKELTVSGWGKTCAECSTSSILLYVDGLNLISREDCTEYWGDFRITDNMICHATENANTCGGDSGGPVITGSGDSNGPPYVQIGIVSWGSSTCEAFVPKVFAEVAKYRNWIDETISGSTSSTCEEDSSSKCGKLAAKGKCSKGKVFFKCKTSCACGVGSNPPCLDTRNKCTKWAAKGKCSEKKVYTKCKSSCACAVEDGSKHVP